MKKTIIFLILLTLALAAVTITPPPNAKADTSEVKVLSYSYYTAPANVSSIASAPGDLIVVGELENVGSQTISGVNVTGIAFDSSGKVLATTPSEGAFVFEMTPGQKAPFYIDFTAQSSQTGDLSWTGQVSKVTVTVTSVADTQATPYTGVKIISDPINSQYDPTAGIYIVSGTIQNNGSEPVIAAWAVVTFYDSSGTVVGVNFTQYLMPYPSPLESGGYSLFIAVPSDCNAQLASKISTFSVIIDAQTAQSNNTQQTSSPTATPATSNAPFPTLPIIVLIVIIVAVTISLLLIRRRQRIPPPPPLAE